MAAAASVIRRRMASARFRPAGKRRSMRVCWRWNAAGFTGSPCRQCVVIAWPKRNKSGRHFYFFARPWFAVVLRINHQAFIPPNPVKKHKVRCADVVDLMVPATQDGTRINRVLFRRHASGIPKYSRHGTFRPATSKPQTPRVRQVINSVHTPPGLTAAIR